MALLLILLALFGFAFATWGSGSSSSIEPVQAQTIPAAEVPSVTGLEPRYALRRVRAAGLVPTARWCAGKVQVYMVGRVVPAEGTVVPRGGRVRIFFLPAHNSGIKPPRCKPYVETRP